MSAPTAEPSCRCCGWIIIVLLLKAQQAPSTLQCVSHRQSLLLLLLIRGRQQAPSTADCVPWATSPDPHNTLRGPTHFQDEKTQVLDVYDFVKDERAEKGQGRAWTQVPPRTIPASNRLKARSHPPIRRGAPPPGSRGHSPTLPSAFRLNQERVGPRQGLLPNLNAPRSSWEDRSVNRHQHCAEMGCDGRRQGWERHSSRSWGAEVW